MPQNEAILDIRDGRYFAAIAFVYGNENRDYLTAVWRDRGGPWTVTARFRYYVDDKAIGSVDQKTSMTAVDTGGRTEEEMVEHLRRTVDELVTLDFNDKLDWIDVKSDDSMVIFEMLAARPWAHLKLDQTAADA